MVTFVKPDRREWGTSGRGMALSQRFAARCDQGNLSNEKPLTVERDVVSGGGVELDW